MQKFTANFPRGVIESGFPFELTNRDWLISISDAAAKSPNIRNTFSTVFFFFFDDDNPPAAGILDEMQAAQLAAVIHKARELNKNVWVHCNAGMCRSGAVVEVLALLGWTLADEFSPRRVPNTHVFSTLRRHFPEISQSWDEKINEMGWSFYKNWINTIV